MPTGKHYFVEQTEEGKFAVKAKGSERASATFETQEQAIEHIKQLNPEDRPDVERVRNLDEGGRDQWRWHPHRRAGRAAFADQGELQSRRGGTSFHTDIPTELIWVLGALPFE